MSVDEFWAWFAGVAAEFGAAKGYGPLFAELHDRVNDLGDFHWEVGPGVSAEHAFVISPRGRLEMLPRTRAIIARAPALPGWEFLPAKPPKQWRMRFSTQDERGELVELDATGWRYAVEPRDDGKVHVAIEAPGLPLETERYRIRAGEIALDGLLGEETRMRHIEGVTMVEYLDPASPGVESSASLAAAFRRL